MSQSESVNAFLNILEHMCVKYDFIYDEDKLRELTKNMMVTVDDSVQYSDWSNRDDIKAVDLILLLHRYSFSSMDNDAVYKSVQEQGENFRKYYKG